MAWENDLERWVEARLIDPLTANRIRDFENSEKKGLRWPAILAIVFGALMLCAGILLFVAAHWDELAPSSRFMLVLAMVGVFHLAGALLGQKTPSLGSALHTAGTASLGAGIYLGGQIFNLQEHWPGGLMLWSLGAAIGWLLLKQWPQALLAAVLVPWWLAGEWDLATEGYRGAWNIATQGLLLLSILYLTATPKEPHRHLRLGMVWAGCLSLIPLIGIVMGTADGPDYYWFGQARSFLPVGLKLLGYVVAYVPVLLLAGFMRSKQSLPMVGAAVWVYLLAVVSRHRAVESNPFIYLWIALGACALCYWGVQQNRKLFINFGTALFSIDLIGFYFSNVLDKLGRSMGLILLGAIFLAGGWVLNRLRTDLIARAAAAGVAR